VTVSRRKVISLGTRQAHVDLCDTLPSKWLKVDPMVKAGGCWASRGCGLLRWGWLLEF
jgi:hypothetical protein